MFPISCAVQTNKSYNLISINNLPNIAKSNKHIGFIVPLKLEITKLKSAEHKYKVKLFGYSKPIFGNTTSSTQDAIIARRLQGTSTEELCLLLQLLLGNFDYNFSNYTFIREELLTNDYPYKAFTRKEVRTHDYLYTSSIIKNFNYKNIELIYFSSDLSSDNYIFLDKKVYKKRSKEKALLIRNVDYIDEKIIMKESKNEVLLKFPNKYDYFIRFHSEGANPASRTLDSWYYKLSVCSVGIIPYINKHKFTCYLDVLDKKGELIKTFKNSFSYNIYQWLPLVIIQHPGPTNDNEWNKQKKVKENMIKNLLEAMCQELSQYGRLSK